MTEKLLALQISYTLLTTSPREKNIQSPDDIGDGVEASGKNNTICWSLQGSENKCDKANKTGLILSKLLRQSYNFPLS